MLLYKRAPYYIIIHLFFGFIAAWIPLIGILALTYQITQYALDIRVFPIEFLVKPGNSLEHTSLKILEMAIGYISGLLVKRLI